MGVRGVEKCNRLQKIAVEESRLGIPLLIGLDVVHGLRTVFPIPLAESCCWSDEIFERSATGINWTFALMIYIARDARWGRAEETVDLLSGLKNTGAEFVYEPCCTVNGEPDFERLHEIISDADVIIAAVSEYADMSGEASSICNIGLHGGQERMLEAVHSAGKPLITVLFNVRPLAIPNTAGLSNAVVEAWHLGSEAGNAICDILFGKYNPSGRLTTTFPINSGKCPLYYNHVPTGRPTSEIRHSCKYMDAPLEPLYPFGYGLSYC